MWCCGCPDFGIGSKHVRETTIGSGRGWSLVEQNLKKSFTISKNFKNGSKSTVSIYSALLGQPDCILVTHCVESIHRLIKFKFLYFRTPKDLRLHNQIHVEILQPIVGFARNSEFTFCLEIISEMLGFWRFCLK